MVTGLIARGKVDETVGDNFKSMGAKEPTAPILMGPLNFFACQLITEAMQMGVNQ